VLKYNSIQSKNIQIIIIIIIIQFFIYLRAELNSRRPITESARNIIQQTERNTHKEKRALIIIIIINI
jgi:hypothetical protein